MDSLVCALNCYHEEEAYILASDSFIFVAYLVLLSSAESPLIQLSLVECK